MIPTQELVDFPEFANNGRKTKPEPVKYSAGFSPADSFPAEYENWLMNKASAGIEALNGGVASMEREINSVVAAGGQTPDQSKTNQLLLAINYLQQALINNALQTVVVTQSSSYSVTKPTTFQINTTQAVTLTLSDTGNAVGVTATVLNNSSVQQTVALGGDSQAVAPNSWLEFAWTGAEWTPRQVFTPRAIDGVFYTGATNINHFGVCSTEAQVQAKVVDCPGFALAAGSRISIKFTEGNTVGTAAGTDSNVIDALSAPTLNVNGTGARTIYVGGEPAGENFIKAGDTHDFQYDGEHWVDVTSNIIYQGENANGNYVKYRGGLIEQSNSVIQVGTYYYPVPLNKILGSSSNAEVIGSSAWIGRFAFYNDHVYIGNDLFKNIGYISKYSYNVKGF